MKLINKVTTTLGFTIQRVKPTYRYKANIDEKPLYVEFVGMSGVGKTTLYKKMMSTHNKTDKWIERRKFLSFYPKVNLENKFSLLHHELIKHKSQAIWNRDFETLDKINLIIFF